MTYTTHPLIRVIQGSGVVFRPLSAPFNGTITLSSDLYRSSLAIMLQLTQSRQNSLLPGMMMEEKERKTLRMLLMSPTWLLDIVVAASVATLHRQAAIMATI